MIKIYTDGSCIGNPGNGGWAAIFIKDVKKTQIKRFKKKSPLSTWGGRSPSIILK